MSIEISKEARAQAVQSIERYFKENMEEPIGNIAAGALLGFFVEEIGPLIYNQAVAKAQERLQERILELQTRVEELDLEVYAEEFKYWQKYDAARRPK